MRRWEDLVAGASRRLQHGAAPDRDCFSFYELPELIKRDVLTHLSSGEDAASIGDQAAVGVCSSASEL
jgi:hypothetical protein